MDNLILKAWDKNNHKIKEWLQSCKGDDNISYEVLLRKTIELIFEGFEDDLEYWEFPDKERICVINNGDYQGTTIYVISNTGYQPNIESHWFTHNYYGSCSGCDTLLSIIAYSDSNFSEEQIDGLWTICLHLMQKMKKMG